MPLVRIEVRNEYRLGLPELYKEANREDSKAVLDGVAASGLVGVLRQLGDLAEFAAEVFHGLQEETMTTASRIHKLMVRVQHFEAALPPLDKTILAQRNDFHFAYTAGTDWHACIQNEQNHFICNDLPGFIMESYEECRDPPWLHLLDKFDTGGPGSCLKRYSDPTFFKGASASPDETNSEKIPKNKKDRRNKKKRTCQRNGEVSHGAAISNQFGSMQLASLDVDEQTSPTQTVSTFDVTLKSDLGKPSNSSDSGCIKCVFHPSSSMKPEEHEPKESSSSRVKMQHYDTLDSAFIDKRSGALDDYPNSSYQEQTGPTSSCVTRDEKTQIMEPTREQCDRSRTPEMFPTNFDLDTQEKDAVNFRSVDQMDFHFDHDYLPESIFGNNQLVDIESEADNYMDALNTIDENPEPTSSEKSGVLEQKSGNQSVETKTFSRTRFKEHFGGGLLVCSPSSSPPLEHMKISFQTVNGSKNSKPTLKFLDRSQFHENSEDMFPSFQLVPEPTIPLHDDVSENDDETSYGSSPYMSDDCLSHHSEQRVTTGTSQNKDHELYDDVFKISPMESVSSFMELEGTAGRSIGIDCGLQSPYAGNGVEPSQSGRLLDLPSFNTLNPLFEKEINNDAKDPLELHFLKEPTPQPPPLPPLEWRAIKIHSDVAENSISLHSEPNAAKQQQQNIEEVIAFPLKCKQSEQLKLNGQKEADETTNSKSMDEKKDFLHQIRTKSFELRCSMTVTPVLTTTNVNKVTAILQKAHAIRQAVGSDDGEEEDDNWSNN